MVFSGSFAPPSVIGMEAKMKIVCLTQWNTAAYCSENINSHQTYWYIVKLIWISLFLSNLFT